MLSRARYPIGLFLVAFVSGAAHAAPLTTQDCLACHGATPTATEQAKPISLYVDQQQFDDSVHGDLGCTACHSDVREFPHAPRPQKVSCATCHSESADQFGQSIHAEKWNVQQLAYPACLECHGNPHGILPKTSSRSPVYPLNLPRTCGRCHGDAALAKRYGIQDVYALYIDSIHGFALTRDGLLVAASCASCHGAHRILGPTDPQSRTYRTNIPANCGSCHAGIEKRYLAGVHGKALEAGGATAPVCTDCHTVHSIGTVQRVSWQTRTVATCGNCHKEALHSYRDTFHGQVTALGFVATARCWTCHESHEILPASDPKSSIAPQNLVATCGTCHRGITASFVSFDPHPNPRSRARNPIVHDAWVFMNLLLLSVFGFFGLHTLLWMARSWVARVGERRAGGPSGPGDDDGDQ
jgi:hypothetical protein